MLQYLQSLMLSGAAVLFSRKSSAGTVRLGLLIPARRGITDRVSRHVLFCPKYSSFFASIPRAKAYIGQYSG